MEPLGPDRAPDATAGVVGAVLAADEEDEEMADVEIGIRGDERERLYAELAPKTLGDVGASGGDSRVWNEDWACQSV